MGNCFSSSHVISSDELNSYKVHNANSVSFQNHDQTNPGAKISKEVNYKVEQFCKQELLTQEGLKNGESRTLNEYYGRKESTILGISSNGTPISTSLSLKQTENLLNSNFGDKTSNHSLSELQLTPGAHSKNEYSSNSSFNSSHSSISTNSSPRDFFKRPLSPSPRDSPKPALSSSPRDSSMPLSSSPRDSSRPPPISSPRDSPKPPLSRSPRDSPKPPLSSSPRDSSKPPSSSSPRDSQKHPPSSSPRDSLKPPLSPSPRESGKPPLGLSPRDSVKPINNGHSFDTKESNDSMHSSSSMNQNEMVLRTNLGLLSRDGRLTNDVKRLSLKEREEKLSRVMKEMMQEDGVEEYGDYEDGYNDMDSLEDEEVERMVGKAVLMLNRGINHSSSNKEGGGISAKLLGRIREEEEEGEKASLENKRRERFGREESNEMERKEKERKRLVSNRINEKMELEWADFKEERKKTEEKEEKEKRKSSKYSIEIGSLLFPFSFKRIKEESNDTLLPSSISSSFVEEINGRKNKKNFSNSHGSNHEHNKFFFFSSLRSPKFTRQRRSSSWGGGNDDESKPKSTPFKDFLSSYKSFSSTSSSSPTHSTADSTVNSTANSSVRSRSSSWGGKVDFDYNSKTLSVNEDNNHSTNNEKKNNREFFHPCASSTSSSFSPPLLKKSQSEEGMEGLSDEKRKAEVSNEASRSTVPRMHNLPTKAHYPANELHEVETKHRVRSVSWGGDGELREWPLYQNRNVILSKKQTAVYGYGDGGGMKREEEKEEGVRKQELMDSNAHFEFPPAAAGIVNGTNEDAMSREEKENIVNGDDGRGEKEDVKGDEEDSVRKIQSNSRTSCDMNGSPFPNKDAKSNYLIDGLNGFHDSDFGKSMKSGNGVEEEAKEEQMKKNNGVESCFHQQKQQQDPSEKEERKGIVDEKEEKEDSVTLLNKESGLDSFLIPMEETSSLPPISPIQRRRERGRSWGGEMDIPETSENLVKPSQISPPPFPPQFIPSRPIIQRRPRGNSWGGEKDIRYQIKNQNNKSSDNLSNITISSTSTPSPSSSISPSFHSSSSFSPSARLVKPRRTRGKSWGGEKDSISFSPSPSPSSLQSARPKALHIKQKSWGEATDKMNAAFYEFMSSSTSPLPSPSTLSYSPLNHSDASDRTKQNIPNTSNDRYKQYTHNNAANGQRINNNVSDQSSQNIQNSLIVEDNKSIQVNTCHPEHDTSGGHDPTESSLSSGGLLKSPGAVCLAKPVSLKARRHKSWGGDSGDLDLPDLIIPMKGRIMKSIFADNRVHMHSEEELEGKGQEEAKEGVEQAKFKNLRLDVDGKSLEHDGSDTVGCKFNEALVYSFAVASSNLVNVSKSVMVGDKFGVEKMKIHRKSSSWGK